MAVDYEAIGAAIATRYEGATPPSGEDALKLVTDDAPEQIGFTPAMVVFVGEDDEEVEWHPSKTRVSFCPFTARLYLEQDRKFADRMARLSKWHGALIDAVVGKIQLNLAYVDWCELVAVAHGVAEYGGTTYDVIDFKHNVRIREQVSAAA